MEGATARRPILNDYRLSQRLQPRRNKTLPSKRNISLHRHLVFRFHVRKALLLTPILVEFGAGVHLGLLLRRHTGIEPAVETLQVELLYDEQLGVDGGGDFGG